jgi:hypothetical protein
MLYTSFFQGSCMFPGIADDNRYQVASRKRDQVGSHRGVFLVRTAEYNDVGSLTVCRIDPLPDGFKFPDVVHHPESCTGKKIQGEHGPGPPYGEIAQGYDEDNGLFPGVVFGFQPELLKFGCAAERFKRIDQVLFLRGSADRDFISTPPFFTGRFLIKYGWPGCPS